jgi:transcriptional regulator of aromatic amino acid metabolism
MSGSLQQSLVSLLVALTGVGGVQLIIFLMKRKTELKALDRTSGGALLEQQGAFADRLSAAQDAALQRVDKLEAKLRDQQEERLRQDNEFIAQLARVNQQNAQLLAQIMGLQNDINIANLQIANLKKQLETSP